MSRQQWGHGFYKGYAEGRKGVVEKKYVCSIADDGHLDKAYMILGEHDNIYTAESLSDMILELVAFGHLREFSESDNDVDWSAVMEISIDDLSKFRNPVFFYDQRAFRSWVIKDFLKWQSEVASNADEN